MSIEHFDCACTSMEHHVRFIVDDEDGDVILEMHLEQHAPWWRRLVRAVKYLFNSETRYGHYECTIIRPEDYRRIRSLLERSEEIIRERSEEILLQRAPTCPTKADV